ncbi:lytic transglycosylase domain-containing protein [Pseudomonas sp. NPDC089569]|uniref:lytic transglycosylase domain-containing protein n=1 Tax=Pseudomonas sp. NPDC089569 TaxID=3390722 RepID=UPI003D01B313
MKYISILLFSLISASQASASPYDPLIDYVATQKGVDPIVLRTIAAQESNKNPWTFNADGEGFQFGDKNSAVQTLWALTKFPWMVKFVSSRKTMTRRFFANQLEAQSFAETVRRSNSGNGTAFLLRTDDSKDVEPGQVRFRQLRLINTDIGIAQINYRWHGQGIATVQQWFDPRFNLNYAADHLADLKKKYGSDLAAVGYYHSSTPAHRKRYIADFMPKYKTEKRNASVPLAIGN